MNLFQLKIRKKSKNENFESGGGGPNGKNQVSQLVKLEEALNFVTSRNFLKWSKVFPLVVQGTVH